MYGDNTYPNVLESIGSADGTSWLLASRVHFISGVMVPHANLALARTGKISSKSCALLMVSDTMLESQQKLGNLTEDTAHHKQNSGCLPMTMEMLSSSKGSLTVSHPTGLQGVWASFFSIPVAYFSQDQPVHLKDPFFRVILPLIDHWGSTLLCLFAKCLTYSSLRTFCQPHLPLWDMKTIKHSTECCYKGERWLKMSQDRHSA